MYSGRESVFNQGYIVYSVRTWECIQSGLESVFCQGLRVYSVRAWECIQSGLESVFNQGLRTYSVSAWECIQSGLESLFIQGLRVYLVRAWEFIHSGLENVFSQGLRVYSISARARIEDLKSHSVRDWERIQGLSVFNQGLRAYSVQQKYTCPCKCLRATTDPKPPASRESHNSALCDDDFCAFIQTLGHQRTHYGSVFYAAVSSLFDLTWLKQKRRQKVTAVFVS